MGPMRTLVHSVTIKDCDVQTFRAGGNGGQNQNKRDTGVRVIHRDSGAVGEARDARSQLQNKRAAFRRMAESETFQRWARTRAATPMQPGPRGTNYTGELREEDCLIEVKRGGKWVPA